MNVKSYLLIGITLILVGILTLIGNVGLFKSVSDLALVIMVLITIRDLITFLRKKPKINISLFSKIINLTLSFVALIFNDYSIAIVPIIFSIYSICNGIACLINFIIARLQKTTEIRTFIHGFVYLSIGIAILFKPLQNLKLFLYIMSWYAIFLGISFILDYLEINNFKRFIKFKISLPSILEAIIPITVLNGINKRLDKNNSKIDEHKKDEKSDLEVIVHVSEKGFGKFGHVDICYKGKIISFGNYDPDHRILHEIFGSGVLFITENKNRYIKFCIDDAKKTLFVFGIKLSDKERIKVEREISKLESDLVPWEFKKKRKNKDYASRLYRATKAQFYKFSKTKYKIFFLFGNNCVSLANRIVNKSLKDRFKLYGVLTPGTYYYYLEREYLKKNSVVVSKKIYHLTNIDKLILEKYNNN